MIAKRKKVQKFVFKYAKILVLYKIVEIMRVISFSSSNKILPISQEFFLDLNIFLLCSLLNDKLEKSNYARNMLNMPDII